jgi:type III pantothenate kinase
VAEKSRKKWVVVDQHHSALVDFSDYKSEMGADRVAGVVGAASEYKPPFCIVDMGTALTFSVVDEEYRYRGGLIMPGVTTMFRSLFTFTHKLPTLELEKFPQTLLGLTTQENIQHGIYHLVSGGIQGILTRLKEEYPSLSIIGTGGWANFFNSFFHQVDCDLILKGLRYFYYQSKRGNGC